MHQAAERALREAMASGHPVALHDAIAEVRCHQLATPFLQQAVDRLATAQQRASEALMDAFVHCLAASLERDARGASEAEALEALDTAAEWAFEVGAEVPSEVRDHLRSGGLRW